MFIPKTDKWVLVRWHGGVRSVVLQKYLLKYLPSGEELMISTVLKVAISEAGKPDTVTVLTSGNNREQLDLLSEPGERTATSDEEQPDPEPEPESETEPDVNDENEDAEEDFEESASDWTPDGPSEEESDNSESDEDTSKRNKPVSKSTPKKRQCTSTKKSSEEFSDDEAETLGVKTKFGKSLNKLVGFYVSSHLKKDRIKKIRREQVVERENNDKKEDVSLKQSKQEAKKAEVSPKQSKQKTKDNNKGMHKAMANMNIVFLDIFRVIACVEEDIKCPVGCKHEEVGVAETGDERINKQASEYFDKTLTPDETDDASDLEFEKTKKKSKAFDKTLTPHESDDEPLATLGKQKTTAPKINKKPSKLCKDKTTTKLLENNRTSRSIENKKLAEASPEGDSSDRDYSSDRSDDPVLISNKYETVETNRYKPEAEWIPIGSGTTLIHKDKFALVNWKSYTKATRTLLTATFSRRTLATHSLTGKKSPAFSHKPAKMCLDPKIVSDIVIEVGDKFKVRDNLVRNIITTKCADECKMRKLKKQKRKAPKPKLPRAANENNDAENHNQENVLTPRRTAKKNNRKSTPPRTINTRKSGRRHKTTPKKLENNTTENVIPEKDETYISHPDNEENVSLTATKSIEKKEEDILSSDDDSAMVIDEDYIPPSENTALKSIENKNRENIPTPEQTRMSLDNNEEYTPSPVNMRMSSRNHENIPPPENNTSKNTKKKKQENIPPPAKKNVKSYKTYKNKFKTK